MSDSRGLEIQVDFYTLEKAEERGTNKEEIEDVIKTGFSVSAKYGRKGKTKVYDFKSKRQDNFYEQKRVEVIYGSFSN